LWLLLWFLFGMIALIATRVATAYVLARGPVAAMLVRQIAIVGRGEDAARLASIMGAGEPGFRLAAVYVVDEPTPLMLPSGTLRLASLAELEDAIRANIVDKVVLAVPPNAAEVLADLLPALRCLPVEVGWAPEPPDLRAPILGLTDLGGVPVLRLSERPLDGWRAILKGIEDRMLAAILLTAAAPALLLIAAAIKVDSPGPVFYRQQRRGFSRESIAVLKFRSMYRELCDGPDAAVVRQATRDDPRVTRVGRILRRTSLDELPQLINVLRGEMSLVGPRPHAMAHDQHYGKLIDNYLARHRVKPGITGWAQVNGYRGETSNLEQMRRRVELDLYYIDHWSIWLDAQILFRTLIVGFVHRQAY
jgi:putative colanic acid biosynthesis UDP-glucose lipid carrier transferase